MNELLTYLLGKRPDKTRTALNEHVIALRVYRNNNAVNKRLNSTIADIEHALKMWY